MQRATGPILPHTRRERYCVACDQPTMQVWQHPEMEWWCERCGQMPSEAAAAVPPRSADPPRDDPAR